MPEFILASASPRRFDLLKLILPEFTVVPPKVDEKLISGESPKDTVVRLASEKAKAVFKSHGAVTVGADTVVVSEGRILGKPADAKDAHGMLTMLRGRTHSVITGVAVVDDRGRLSTNAEETNVEFRNYTPAEVKRYIETGDPMDKAGAYAIQHPEFHPAKRIKGCYFNVVGLPLCTVSVMLISAGVTLRVRRPGEIPDFCFSNGICPLGHSA